MYGDVVMGVQKRPGEDHEPFEIVIERRKRPNATENNDFPDVRLTVRRSPKSLCNGFKALIKERTGKSFPQDPQAQLWGAIGAVFGSWMNDRGDGLPPEIRYPARLGNGRECADPWCLGTWAKRAQPGSHLHGNPATGEKVFYGEYLINAQGEDVVAGVRTPHPNCRFGEANARSSQGANEGPRDA